jgi:hypothetical protein
MKMNKSNAQTHREEIRGEFWPDEIAWTGEKPEVGWFRAPRTLPLVLQLLRSKKVTGSASDPTRVYLELLARHRDTGIVEMETEGEHSYYAGHVGPRGARTWQERMRLLEKLGFIKARGAGNQKYKYVLLVHPTIVVKRLYDAGKIDQLWWDTYRQRQIETKERTYEKLVPVEEPENVVPIEKAAKTSKLKAKASPS